MGKLAIQLRATGEFSGVDEDLHYPAKNAEPRMKAGEKSEADARIIRHIRNNFSRRGNFS